MKRISTILHFALLLLVGTGLSFAQGNHITVSTNTLTFPPTMIGTSSVQSYTFNWWDGEVNSGIRIDITLGGSDHSLFQYQLNSTTGGWNDWNPNNPVFSSYIYGATGSLIVYVKFTPKSQSAGNVGLTSNDVHKLGPAPGYPDYGTIYHPSVALVSSENPLPIQLASFSAAFLTGNTVSLTWTTASEINNYGFEAQRSFDGKTFATIAGSFVHGNGTTNQSHTYSYVDADPAGATSYRLKQMDLDGTLNYSEPVHVATTTDVKELKPEVFALEQNYPNPFNPSTRIIFSIVKEGPISLRVYDVLGSEVALLVNENRQPGQYTEQFNGSRLASGVYMYVLRSSEGQLVGRMMLSK